jgi:hypothetical protein
VIRLALSELRCHVDELTQVVGVAVEIHEEGAQVFIILRGLPLPPGSYRVPQSDVLFITDTQYPMSAMDMFWTNVDVLLPDGAIPLNADSIETYLGRQWRRFSWHRNGVWNPRGNPLLDHYEFMLARFAQDVKS